MNLQYVIPCRLNSKRLPGKALVQLAGKSIIQRVYEQVQQVKGASPIIATDSDEIAKACSKFNATIVRTSSAPRNGTERIAEVAKQLKWSDTTRVINIQGDEPLINPQIIEDLVLCMREKNSNMATVVTDFHSNEEYFDQNTAKVLVNASSQAISFSRRGPDCEHFEEIRHFCFRHIGLYGYSIDTLNKIMESSPCSWEIHERLEQLRALWLNIPIDIHHTDKKTYRGVDTLDDLKYLEDEIAS